MDDRKTILISGVGLSPAVLTNTVWALAHESRPVIPDEVLAITTITGRDCIRQQLIQRGGWDRLSTSLGKEGISIADRLAFGSSDSIRVIGDGKRDFDDIATPEQNDVAADFILKVLRQYTEDPGTRVVVSIAGGRKSMSALLMSCMSLLGREQDRVCHVLVNEPYEQRMDPPFLFPEKGLKHRFGDKTYASLKANPQLSDIPFVRVRGLYFNKTGEPPASYSVLVARLQSAAPPPAVYPCIELHRIQGDVRINGVEVRFTPTEFLLLLVLCERFIKKSRAFESWDTVSEEINDLMKQNFPFACGWHEKVLNTGYRTKRWTKIASAIRQNQLKNTPSARALIPAPGDSITFPPNNIKIIRTSRDIPKNKK